MLDLNLGHESDEALIVRTAWLYYMDELTQAETAKRLGLPRTRVVRLLSEARNRGLVSITIQQDSIRDLEIEAKLAHQYGLDFCLATPPTGLPRRERDTALVAVQGLLARRAVGSLAANLLKGKLLGGHPLTVGISWGRTLEQMALHLGGVRNPKAQFVSLMGSLTRNSASNPFEVVQALAARTGGEGHFLPVPFVADTEADREVLMSQRSVGDALALACSADLFLISVGELAETASLRQQEMISAAELASVRAMGAVCDALGLFFNSNGQCVQHEVARRTLAIDLERLRGRDVMLLGAGISKTEAINGLLRTGLVRGLVIDGDTARLLINRAQPAAGRGRSSRRNGPSDPSTTFPPGPPRAPRGTA
jgi:DNA-binding transcriptional regulator LsrR (DeoR family)